MDLNEMLKNGGTQEEEPSDAAYTEYDFSDETPETDEPEPSVDDLFFDAEFEGRPDREQYRKPRKTRIGKKHIIIAAVCLAAVLILGGILFAVIRNTRSDEYDNTGSFYFSSDLLTTDGGEFTVYNEIAFLVRNFADKLRISEETIESFTVTVVCDGKDITSECAIEKERATLEAGGVATSLVTVRLPDDYNGVPVEIETVSRPTEIRLRGTFTVVPSWGYSFSDKEGSVSGKLVIWANEEITLTVTWDPELMTADPTNAYVKSGADGSSCDVTLAAGTGCEIYFFKENINADYSLPDFEAITVRKTGGPGGGNSAPTGNPEN